MPGFTDVRNIAIALPEVAELPWASGHLAWRVRKKLFVWERPLRDADFAALGDSAPDGPILGARVESELEKRALIEDPSGAYFTTPHFDGYAAILVQLDAIPIDQLEELIVEAWLLRAPKRVARAYLDEHPGIAAS